MFDTSNPFKYVRININLKYNTFVNLILQIKMSKVTKRKHVTKLQEDFSIPLESQSIVQLVEPRGNNLHEVSDSTGERFLVSMPSIFRNNVYVKRGDFVLVESIPEGDKVKAEIIKVLTEVCLHSFLFIIIIVAQGGSKMSAFLYCLEYSILPAKN